MRKLFYFMASVLVISVPAVSQADEPIVLDNVLVTGGQEKIVTMSGSAQILEKQTLEQFDSSDLNQVMATLPGIYIRQEDGYGLRPNIGIRGATSERSQKITIMTFVPLLCAYGVFFMRK